MSTQNFLQWNPGLQNQETDAQYSADTLRTGGAANPSVFPSATANKLFYQITTFITALATALANKGYAMSDANLTNLAGQFANLMTLADMTPYAPLASPALTGTPSAPTPASTDNSTHLATTAFVKAAQLNGSGSFGSGTNTHQWVRLPNGLILAWGTCAAGVNYTANYITTFTFPDAPPFTQPPFVQLTGNAGSIGNSAVFSVVPSTTQTNGFGWSVSQSGNEAATYLALGY